MSKFPNFTSVFFLHNLTCLFLFHEWVNGSTRSSKIFIVYIFQKNFKINTVRTSCIFQKNIFTSEKTPLNFTLRQSPFYLTGTMLKNAQVRG